MSIRDRLPKLASPLGWRNAARFAPSKRLQGGVADHFPAALPDPARAQRKRVQAARRVIAAEQARRATGGH